MKALRPDGAVELVRRLPGDAHTHVAFAVSPDDRQIAVGVLAYHDCSHPGMPLPHDCASATTTVYVEDLRGGHRRTLFAPAHRYEWPVGWHRGRVILAVSTPATQQGDTNPYYAYYGYQLVSSQTGNLFASVCTDQGANAIGALVQAGSLCQVGGSTYVDSWDGKRRQFPGLVNTYALALSPDGTRVASRDGPEVVLQTIDGSKRTIASPLAEYGMSGWLDAHHLLIIARASLIISRGSTTINTHYQVLDLATGRLTPQRTMPVSQSVDAPMFFGTLPANL